MTLRAMLVTLDINVEKARFASFFHLFFYLFVFVDLGFGWCGGVLMYCSSLRNFTFCFY